MIELAQIAGFEWDEANQRKSLLILQHVLIALGVCPCLIGQDGFYVLAQVPDGVFELAQRMKYPDGLTIGEFVFFHGMGSGLS